MYVCKLVIIVTTYAVQVFQITEEKKLNVIDTHVILQPGTF